MKTNKLIIALLCFLAIASSAWAKRGAAPLVEPVIYENIQYSAPNNDGEREYIEAWDIRTHQKLWELTILTNRMQLGLEKDVQWIFIENLKIKNEKLLIIDERAREFIVDIKTRQMKRLK